MKRSAAELSEFLGGRLEGDGGRVVEALASLETASEGDLSYAESRYLEQVRLSRASCVLVPEGEFPGQTTIVVDNPKAAFARAAEWLFPKPGPTAGIHPTAQIGKGVQLGAGVMVGPRCVIEDDVEIGPSTAVHPGCYIAEGVRIGAECTIRPNVVFYQGVEVHDRVIIHAGVILGSDGFGFVRDGAGYVKFPQIGRLVIEDDVEIGANSCIDRGALGATVIERGTKLDNLCHVAHNVRIGAHTVIAAQTGISGSCDIGANAVIAGQVGIADHVRIDDGSIVGAQCGIPSGKRIRAGEIFWGTPARPLKDIKVQQAYLSRLPRIAKEVARLGEEVDRLKDSSG